MENLMVAPNSTAPNTVTREVAKELSFEDISVHSPGLFRKGDNMVGGGWALFTHVLICSQNTIS
jgi:hypothetical protein